MTPDELLLLLTSLTAARDVDQAIHDPDLQKARGWNLTRWKSEAVADAIRFIHHNRHGRPDSAVLCVRAPADCQWAYESALRLAPFPTTLVRLEN